MVSSIKILFVVAATILTAPIMAATLSCRVISVTDGDTIRCLDSSQQQYRIRFAGIDAPESKQAFGKQAKQTLSSMIYQKNVKIDVSSTDRYGRSIGTVYLSTEDINRKMVASGYAWAYRQYSTKYVADETMARSKKLGLWRDKNPVAPWQFRHQKKAANHIGVKWPLFWHVI